MANFNDSATVKLLSPINPVLNFSDEQIKHRNYIQEKIDLGYLRFVNSLCFCGSNHNHFKLIEKYDAWGFNIPTIMCKNCGSIRSQFVFDEQSIHKFYSEGFYRAHMFTFRNHECGIGMHLNDYINEEINKGEQIYRWLKSQCLEKKFKSVLEIGAGCGGITYFFQSMGYQSVGCDLNKEYIEFGKTKFPEIELINGSLDKIADRKFDLIILSDVVEHVYQLHEFLNSIKNNMHDKTLLYINVPGFFGISNRRFGCSVRQYSKIEHVWGFTLESLKYVMFLNGFKFLNGSQYVRAVFNLNKNLKYNVHSFFLYKIKLIIFIYTLPIRKKLTFSSKLRKLLIATGFYHKIKIILGVKNLH